MYISSLACVGKFLFTDISLRPEIYEQTYTLCDNNYDIITACVNWKTEIECQWPCPSQFKDLRFNLRSWLSDIDQLRGWTEQIQIHPEADQWHAGMSENQRHSK